MTHIEIKKNFDGTTLENILTFTQVIVNFKRL